MSNKPVFKVGDKVICIYPEINRHGKRDLIGFLDTFEIIGMHHTSDGQMLEIKPGQSYYGTRFLNLSRVNKDQHTKKQIEFINNILKQFPELMATEFIEFDKTGMFKIRE